MNMPFGPGDILLGKYRIERVLGQGGMGVVVAARHVELGQPYAIKFLLPTVLTHDEAVERFLREARAAARLTSEHVAHVHDVGRMENGAPFMVMEYLEGHDLKAVVSKEGPLPANLAMTYLSHVCDAIAEAHAAGIVHRDLKPANLFLVRRRNGNPCVKGLDFGISKQLGANEVDLTATNATLGSPLYMSPEQISKSKSVDTRTDIWALGVILYELLTGISPFRAGTALEVVSRILQEEPVPIRHLRPDVPARAELVIARCLQKRREERFQTVEELLAVLDGSHIAAQVSALPSTTMGPSDASMTASGHTPYVDPTSVSFGHTGDKPLRKQPNPLVLVFASAMGVMFVGGSLFGLRAVLATKSDASTAATPVSANATSVLPSVATTMLPVPVDTQIVATDAGLPDAEVPNGLPSETTSVPEKSRAITPATNQPPRGESVTTTKKKRSAL